MERLQRTIEKHMVSISKAKKSTTQAQAGK